MLGKGQGSQPLSGAGNHRQPREVDSHSISDHCLLGNQDRLADFPGFGDSLEDRKDLLNAEEFLSSKVQSAKFWRVLLGHLASLSRLVPNGQLRMRALQLALSRGWDFRDEDILVPWDPPSRDDLLWWCTEGRLGGDFSSPELSRPNVLVRRLQPRLGGHGSTPVRFQSLVGGQGLSLDQPTRVVGRRERPQGSLFLFGGSGCRSLLRQYDCGGVSEKAGRDLVSGSERCSPAHSALGGAVEYHPDAAVCSREEQCGGGRAVSPQSGSRLGVDAPSGCVQLAPPALTGDNRPVCLLTQSLLLYLICAGVGSHGCGYGCHAPAMRFATGVCLPSIRHDQPGLGEGEPPQCPTHCRRGGGGGLKRQQVAALLILLDAFFLLCLTFFFSPSALNDLAGPSAGPLARKT